jgi:protocatechuate 3,4-dioxygenase, beta subunit
VRRQKEEAAVTVSEYVEVDPPYLYADYQITNLRAPLAPPVVVPDELLRRAPGPNFRRIPYSDSDADLNHQHPGQPIGQRIILFGRVLDSAGQPVPGTLIETWQVNGAGRYADPVDPAFFPLDPNFTGAGRCMTGPDGSFEFLTLRPAAYPGERGGLYRPSHIHVSVFGPYLASRLITQCYFADDPLLQRDPIFQSVPSANGMRRLISQFEGERTEHNGEDSALAYRWDIVLRGGTPSSLQTTDESAETTSPSQTIGPLYGFALMFPGSELAADPAEPGSVRIRGRVFDGAGKLLAHPEAMLELWAGDEFARTRTGADGVYTAVLTKPAPSAGQAPHLNVAVYARGLLKQAQTRLYFPDEQAANEADPVLAAVPAERRPRLMARQDGDELVFDIHLQGEDESVFFAF